MGNDSPAIAGEIGSGSEPVDASVVAPLATFLDSLLVQQIALSGAESGLIWLYATRTRQAGVVAARASADRPQPSAAMVRSITQRVERVADKVRSDGSAGAAARPLIEQFTVEDGDGVYRADASHLLLILPLAAAGIIEGVTALVLRRTDARAATDAATRAGLAALAFETYLWKQNTLREGEQRARLHETLELLDAVQQGSDVRSMGAILCHEIRRRFACERVSIGLVSGDSIKVAGLSGADTIDPRSPAAELLRDAMEECAVQDCEVVFPSPAESDHDPASRRIVRSHARLSDRDGPSSILSLPLRIEGDLVGVLVLERAARDPFPAGAVSLLRLVAEFVGPSVWTRRLADRGVLAVARDRAIDLGRAIVGPRHTGWKLVGASLVLVFLGLALIPIPDRVPAEAEIRAVTSRTIPPPFAGYLAESFVRPGDRVAAGDVLGRMEVSELTLQLEQETGKRSMLETERDNAHASGDLSTWRRATRGIDESDARIALLKSSVDRSEIRAPIDGIVSRGDLEDYLGARVEPTTALFEVVTPERLAVLRVDERDAHRVTRGQRGWLTSTANPGRRIPITVERINPAAEAVEGGNVFLVEASIDNPPEFLHPGTGARVRLRDGWTTGLAALARPIVDEFRLRIWW